MKRMSPAKRYPRRTFQKATPVIQVKGSQKTVMAKAHTGAMATTGTKA
jgi:hypothetical protein